MQLTFFCPPYAGHLNPMFAAGAALQRRGHRVDFVGIADIGASVRRAGLGFGCETVGQASHPPGMLERLENHLAGLRGLLGIGRVIADVAAMTEMLCREAPAVLQRTAPDAIVYDQLEPAGGLLAQRFGLPGVSVANALMLEREPYVPPPFTDWAYARTDWARERNQGGYRVADWMMGRVGRVIAHWSQAFGLAPRRTADQCVASTQIGQLSALLDFPRESLPDGFAYTGPLRLPAEAEPMWQPPPGRLGPFAFVSLGSLQGGRFELIGRITKACRHLGLTAVVAHNGRLTDVQAAALPGAPIVERFVPQRRVIGQCALVVSHGGLNTVLDALSLGVPLVLLPLAMEQGAIAQRVLRTGAGRVLRPGRGSVRAFARAIGEVLDSGACRSAAQAVGTSLRAGGGAVRAAQIIEQAVQRQRLEQCDTHAVEPAPPGRTRSIDDVAGPHPAAATCGDATGTARATVPGDCHAVA